MSMINETTDVCFLREATSSPGMHRPAYNPPHFLLVPNYFYEYFIMAWTIVVGVVSTSFFTLSATNFFFATRYDVCLFVFTVPE